MVRKFMDVPQMLRQSRQGGDYVASYVEQWRHFIGAIKGDSMVTCTLADGERALEIALAAREANATKRAVRLGKTAQAKVANESVAHEIAVSGHSQN
jgi:predicted dehydrogenase